MRINKIKHKTACLTFDVEPDFTTRPGAPHHIGLFEDESSFKKWTGYVKDKTLPITCFVVGDVLKENPASIKKLSDCGAEFGSHSLSHDLNRQESEQEIRGGIQTFKNYFGYTPEGYRSPRGRLKKGMITMLEEEGIRYDSSLIPSVRPGEYWNGNRPLTPFRWKDSKIIEIPMGVLPVVRLQFALSYIKIFNPISFRILNNFFGLPDPLVILFHPMDLVFHPIAFENMNLSWKMAYSINRGNSFSYFYWMIDWLDNQGYSFEPVSKVLNGLSQQTLSEVDY